MGSTNEWTEYTDKESGELYFFNQATRISAWNIPADATVVPPALTNDTSPPAPTPFAEGAMVWVPDEDEVCNPAWVRAPFDPGHGGEVCFDESAGAEPISLTNVETAALLPMEARVLDPAVDDLITLDELNEFAILHKLRLRYFDDEIYTSVSSVLVSVNPFKSLPIYTDEIKARFLDPKAEEVRQLPPHIWGVGRRAYMAMVDRAASQSILVSGESGAGKTEATKYILQYLVDASSQASGSGGSGGKTSLEQQILDASPILETFGNAKTVRNNNSSRFGKLVKVGFSAGGSVVGASVANYLLEKSRVVGQGVGERNYHAFYQLLAAHRKEAPQLAAGGVAEMLGLGAVGRFMYLTDAGSDEIAGVDDAAAFEETMAAFETMGFGETERADVLRVLGAVLLAGQTAFVASSGADGAQQTAVEKAGDIFSRAAACLGVDGAALEKSMCYRNVGARGEVFSSPNEPAAAADARDALCKKLYANLFDWLVSKITRALNSGRGGDDAEGGAGAAFFCNVLDIFGFESFEHNSFEQLCINYCNEKLHFFFNEHIFSLEQEEYERQGIEVPTIEFDDNAPTLALIDAPRTGLLAMMDEEVRLPGGSDTGFLSKVSKLKNLRLKKTSVKQADSRNCFTVMHFAGDIAYNVTGFLDKNKDTVPEDVAACLATSTVPFVALLMADDEGGRLGFKRRSSLTSDDKGGGDKPPLSESSGRVGGGKKKKVASLGAKFKQQMASLMDTLNGTEPHFVRTVKPNDKQVGGEFDARKVQFQLRCNGLMEVCQIRQVGYPVRMAFDDFVAKYRHLDEPNAGDVDSLCHALSRIGALQRDQWAKGHSKIFMRVRSMFRLDHWEEICAHAIAIVQHFARGAVELARYRSYKRTLASLSAALIAHDYEGTQAAMAECKARLPGGGKHTAQMKAAKEALPALKKEHGAKQDLKKATEKRKKAGIEKAIEKAEKMGEPTLDNSPEMAAARRMLELLEKEDGLKRGLTAAVEARAHGRLRQLLGESDALGLTGPEVDAGKDFEQRVDKMKAALRSVAAEGTAPEVVDALLARASSECGILAKAEREAAAAAADADTGVGEGAEEYDAAAARSAKLKALLQAITDAARSHDSAAAAALLAEAETLGMGGEAIERAKTFLGQVAELTEKLAAATKVGNIEELERILAEAKDQGMSEIAEYKAAHKARLRINEMRHALRESTETKNKMRLAKLVAEAAEMGLETAEVQAAQVCLLEIELKVAVQRQDAKEIEALLRRAQELGPDALGGLDMVGEAAKCKEQLDLRSRVAALAEEIEANTSNEFAADGDVADEEGTSRTPAMRRAELDECLAKATDLGVEDSDEVRAAIELKDRLDFEDNALAELKGAMEAKHMAKLANVLLNMQKLPQLDGTPEVREGKKMYTELMEKYKQTGAGLNSGYLNKMGAKHKVFRKRWIVLKDMQLLYYKNEAAAKKSPDKPKGTLGLDSVSSVARADEPVNSLKLVTPTRTWLFKADDGDTRAKWEGELRNLVLAAMFMKQQREEGASSWATRHKGVETVMQSSGKKVQIESKIISIDTIQEMRSRPANSAARRAEVERIRGAAQEAFRSEEAAQLCVRHGRLFTGPLLVKQDLESYENLYKPSAWRHYYFVLTSTSTLYVFEDSRCTDLHGWVLITPDSTVYPTSLGPYSFQVVTPYLVAHLDSEDEGQTLKWIRAIGRAIKHSPADHLPEPILHAARKIALQENLYDIEFLEKKPLGMKLKPKTKYWAIVTAAKPESGISVSSVLAKVNGDDVHITGYHQVVATLKSWQPPLKLTFRSPPKGGGFLLQRTPTSKKWKTRFLDLNRGALLVYSTDEDKSVPKSQPMDKRYKVAILKEFLDLEGACIRVLPRSEIGKDWCFVLVGGTGSLILQARDEHDMIDWCSMLHYAASMANAGDFVIKTLTHADEVAKTEADAKKIAQQRAIDLMAGSSEQNICEGYLNKLALGVRHKRRIRSWKKRYFVMQQEGEFYRLAYYTDKEKGQLKGTVEINTQMQVDISEMREHTFRMFDHTTEIVLQAPDDAERKKWMDAVNSSVQTLKKKGIGAVKKTKTKVKASKRGSVFTFEQPAGKPSQA